MRLVGSEEFNVDTPLKLVEVVARLRDAINARDSIEIDPKAKFRRRLSGSIDGPSIRLTVHDDNIFTRKKSWNIEFNAEISQTPRGSSLRGAIEVPDRNALSLLVYLFKIGSVLAVVIATGLAARTAISGGAVDFGPPTMGVVISSVAVIAFGQLKKDGETAAAGDAKLLDGFMRRLLNVEAGG